MGYFKYILCFLLLALNLKAEAKSLDTLFQTSHYSESVELLEEELTKGEDANTYYNLALSYNKLGNKAQAILSIERSYYLNPYDSETREVMAMLYKSTEGANRYERGFLLSLADSLAYMFTMTSWIVWALLFFIASMSSLIYYFYTSNALHQRLAFYSFLVLLLFSLFANGAIAHQYYYHHQVEDLAIVKEQTSVYTEANEDSQVLTDVFVGNRLELIDNNQELSSTSSWQAVRLPNKEEGYIEKAFISNVIEAIN